MIRPPRRINLKHLRYFLEIARTGQVNRAADALHVAPQTVSAQLRELEDSIGHPLFQREGRSLRLTADGELAREYAASIFALSDELAAVLDGRATPRQATLRLGVTDSVPKLLTVAVLDPVLARHPGELLLSCREGTLQSLLAALSARELDAVLAELPAPPTLASTLQSVSIMESGLSFLAAPGLKPKPRGAAPGCLDGVPFITGFPEHSWVAQALDAWFAHAGVAPRVVARLDDSALAKHLAQRGFGVLSVPDNIEQQVVRQHRLRVIGRTREVRQSLFLIRPRGRRPHPVVEELERPVG
jgi:LysR family transcriptional activator of nhaA